MAVIPRWAVPPAIGQPSTPSTTPTPRAKLTTGTQAGTAAEVIAAALPSGIIAYVFGAIDLAASLSASKLYVAVPGSASVGGRQLSRAALFAGEIVAIEISADAAKTAGTATFEVYVDGSPSGAQLIWTDGEQQQTQTFGRGVYTFAAGAALDLRVTTDSGLAPAGSADVLATVYIAQTTADQ